jgi:hypothetical protein
MKKITLILPDKITKVGGTSRSIYEREVELTAEEVIKILCEKDYHSSYKICEKDVTVVSVEDYP